MMVWHERCGMLLGQDKDGVFWCGRDWGLVSDYNHLYDGVFEYMGKRCTFDRDILKCLGYLDNSWNVRARECLGRIVMCEGYLPASPSYWSDLYNLGYSGDDSFRGFVGWLSDRVSWSDGSGRYPMAVNLGTMQREVVTDFSLCRVLPLDWGSYEYYGVSKSLGYQMVRVSAFDEESALMFGRAEFVRQFGELADNGFCSLVHDGSLVSGMPVVNLKYEESLDLCQSLVYGYTQNYEGYASKLRSIGAHNGVADISDIYIKYLFVNSLAVSCRRSQCLVLGAVALATVWFIGVVRRGEAPKLLLTRRLPYVKRDLKSLCIGMDGKVSTDNGIFTIQGGKAVSVDVMVEGTILGSIDI